MAFRFPLETLLRLRAMQTRQEEVRLESLAQQLVLARQQRQELHQRRRAHEYSLLADLRQGEEASELHLGVVGRHGLVEADRRLERAIEELQLAWHEQERKFFAARQREEVLKSLRDRQLATYKDDERRHEQQLVDDLFLSRHGRTEA
jgi:flagellar biosynthesis chaperone FliJ